jgi:hypothetical protein
MTGHQVKLVLDGETGDASPVDTGMPQGLPAAPILIVTYLSGIFDKVERAVPGIKGLSFADDIVWWARGEDEDGVAAKLAEAAAASVDWAKENGVAFDSGKTAAALFWKKKTALTATIRVGTSDIPFNTEATHWLSVWLDTQLMLKVHHAIRLKEGRKALGRLCRLTGRMGLSPVNCWKVMTAYIQSVAMFGSELWWKGDRVVGTIGRTEEVQKEGNKQARAVTGCFRTSNRGALVMESGLSAATAQLENRQRRFRLRLLSLPQVSQAREVVGVTAQVSTRLAAQEGFVQKGFAKESFVQKVLLKKVLFRKVLLNESFVQKVLLTMTGSLGKKVTMYRIISCKTHTFFRRQMPSWRRLAVLAPSWRH